ncbi:hypothetical protein IJF81_01480 [bacterium]|nr:hypothetical protein [bacterium]
MDKRVIAIIVILIIGLGCMFHIATTSNTVGSAITTFSKTSVTLPDGFSVGDTSGKTAELYNKNSAEKINITDLGKNDTVLKEFEHNLYKLSKNQTIKDISNSTKTINNLTVYTITYESDNGTEYNSFVYTYNHTYSINMVGFKDADRVNGILDFVVKTIVPDYKQGSDK